jgi:hypothetical protein
MLKLFVFLMVTLMFVDSAYGLGSLIGRITGGAGGSAGAGLPGGGAGGAGAGMPPLPNWKSATGSRFGQKLPSRLFLGQSSSRGSAMRARRRL